MNKIYKGGLAKYIISNKQKYNSTDWDEECKILKIWLDYIIDNHCKHLLEQERINSKEFKMMTPGYRQVFDYKTNELRFSEWRLYTDINIPFKKPITKLV